MFFGRKSRLNTGGETLLVGVLERNRRPLVVSANGIFERLEQPRSLVVRIRILPC
jgi:hypothetical protein